MIRVVVAEDSPTVRELMVSILESDPGITVVGQARNGQEAVELTQRLRPDLVTMDINMPVMDGLEATKEIMVHAPTPILIATALTSPDLVELSLSATRAGALMVVTAPTNPRSPDFAEHRDRLVAMAKAMAQVKVVRRWAPRRTRQASPAPPAPDGGRAVRLVAIAASTGGPAALQRILMDLPREFSPPILVVQHIATGFVGGLAHWLATSCNLHVKVAEAGEALRPRTVYIAPDDRHLGVSAEGVIRLSGAPAIGGFRPSATHLFESAAAAYGPALAAVILTGMGRDGVDGLRAVRDAGGWVLAQDEASCVVYGMPREAVRSGLVDGVVPLTEVAAQLAHHTLPGMADGASDSGR